MVRGADGGGSADQLPVTPFGYALFYMRAISPPEVSTGDIIRGVVPFIVMVLLMCGLIVLFPQLVTWLPATLYQG